MNTMHTAAIDALQLMIANGDADGAYTQVRVIVHAIAPERFNVIDGHTSTVCGTYATFTRSRNMRDKLDMAYGGIRYHVKSTR